MIINMRSDLHKQYYWLSSHRNMIGYSLYSLNARPPKCTPEARSRQLALREVPLYVDVVRFSFFFSSFSLRFKSDFGLRRLGNFMFSCSEKCLGLYK